MAGQLEGTSVSFPIEMLSLIACSHATLMKEAVIRHRRTTNHFLNSFGSFWNCLLITFSITCSSTCWMWMQMTDMMLASAKVMKFVRASHCVHPVLVLSSEGSVLLVQTMHPDPLGISHQIRETQPNKTELLSNTHILTSSALPYGSVIKPRREAFLSMCVCLCVPMTSQPHKQNCWGGICWQLKNWASK